MYLLLTPGEHVLGCHVADGTVQADVVVKLDVALYLTPRILQRHSSHNFDMGSFSSKCRLRMATFSSGAYCFRCFFMRSLLYLNGRTPSPFPTEPEHMPKTVAFGLAGDHFEIQRRTRRSRSGASIPRTGISVLGIGRG